MSGIIFLDCTLRDGGYYNAWDFDRALVEDYLSAVSLAGVDAIELGLRSLKNEGFKGPYAYTSNELIASLPIPSNVKVGVMVNASELLAADSVEGALKELFPEGSEDHVDLVRIACHSHEFVKALPAAEWLKGKGYAVGFNLMQIADKSPDEISALASQAQGFPIDALYFADSMGGMSPEDTTAIIGYLRKGWRGELGIHTHDNMSMALQNSLRAIEGGVSWIDSTVTGMGRGPGNARTEELAIEIAERRGESVNLVPLMNLVQKNFKPMQEKHGWGTNPFYYLAGKYGIHPTYVQEMLSDSRYDYEDVLAVIDHLKVEGGKAFSLDRLGLARDYYSDGNEGEWSPASLLEGREVLLLGSGPGVAKHRDAIESYIRRHSPVVLALNTQSEIMPDLIDAHIACHPVRLLADCEQHMQLPQPLIVPASGLPTDASEALKSKQLYDFALNVEKDTFRFADKHCVAPNSLVLAYALAVAASGKASNVLMAGFDGYSGDDPRTEEVQVLIKLYLATPGALSLTAVTPSRYALPAKSIYAM